MQKKKKEKNVYVVWLSCSTTYENFEIRHQEAEKGRGLSYSVTILSKKSFPSRSLVPNFKAFWIIIWHQEQKPCSIDQSNLVARAFPRESEREPPLFLREAGLDYDFNWEA